MSNTAESAPAAGETRPKIETLGEAAAEINRLHVVLGASAIELTNEFLDQQLAGEEGVTWSMFPRGGFLSRPTPYLPDVMRLIPTDARPLDTIVLGAGYNMWNNLLREYDLTADGILVPDNKGSYTQTDAVRVHRWGRGYDPGEKYLVTADQVLKAPYKHYDSAPTVGAHGGLAWSAGHSVVDKGFVPLEEVTPELLKVVDDLRRYEPVAAPTEIAPIE